MRSAADPLPVDEETARLVPAYGGTSGAFDFVREQRDGHTTLIVPSGPPPAAQRAVLLRESALSAGVPVGLAIVFLIVPVVVLSAVPVMGGPRGMLVGALSSAFVFAFFGIVWRTTYQTRLDLLAEARRERTTFDVDPDGRLTVDVRVRMPGRVYEVPPGGVHRVQVLRWVRASAAAELAGLPMLLVHRTDGNSSLKLLAGRDVREVEAVGAALAAALGVPAPERANPWRRPIEWFAGRFVISSHGQHKRTH